MEIIGFPNQFNNNIGESDVTLLDSESFGVAALAKRFSDELKAAKSVHFANGEVLLPPDLTKALAVDVFEMADTELCGLKGCTIYINFESSEGMKRLSVINWDTSMPSTFELYLTLKQNSGWNQFLPQFLKKMTRGAAVMISSEYDLQKRKLYRSFDDRRD